VRGNERHVSAQRHLAHLRQSDPTPSPVQVPGGRRFSGGGGRRVPRHLLPEPPVGRLPEPAVEEAVRHPRREQPDGRQLLLLRHRGDKLE
jgi:hypothetical protein